MSKPIPIRDYAKIYPSNTLWIQPDGFVETEADSTSAISSLFRISPLEAAKAPDMDAYIRSELQAQAKTHPERARKLLHIHRKSCFKKDEGDSATIAFLRLAKGMLDFQDPAIVTNYLKRERVQTGSGIEVLVDYAREHAHMMAENPEMIAEIKEKLQTSGIDVQSQRHNIERVIGSLPPYYGAALKRMGGIEIAVNEGENSSYEDSGLLGIQTGCIRDLAMLQNVIPEEIQHFMDAKLGFTDTPTWRNAVNQQYAFLMNASPMYGVLLEQFVSDNFRPDAANEAEIVTQIAEHIVHTIGSKFPDLSVETARRDVWLNWMGEKTGKSNPFGSSYRARQGNEAAYKELLPDVLRELHKHTAAGKSPEDALAATSEIYGHLAELAVRFEKAVEQFAETGRQPAELFRAGRTAEYGR